MSLDSERIPLWIGILKATPIRRDPNQHFFPWVGAVFIEKKSWTHQNNDLPSKFRTCLLSVSYVPRHIYNSFYKGQTHPTFPVYSVHEFIPAGTCTLLSFNPAWVWGVKWGETDISLAVETALVPRTDDLHEGVKLGIYIYNFLVLCENGHTVHHQSWTYQRKKTSQVFFETPRLGVVFFHTKPWKINGWNLPINHLERKMIWTQTSMTMFHVNLQGLP